MYKRWDDVHFANPKTHSFHVRGDMLCIHTIVPFPFELYFSARAIVHEVKKRIKSGCWYRQQQEYAMVVVVVAYCQTQCATWIKNCMYMRMMEVIVRKLGTRSLAWKPI